jgi:hypothetical protein
MKPEVFSAAAALVSALSAMIMIYLYRKQGKGFIWTKDPKLLLTLLPTGIMDLAVEIPLYNLGFGNIQFNNLKAKKIYLKNNSIESFEADMDEAYFPSGVLIVNYKTPIFSDIKVNKNLGMATQLNIQLIGKDINSVDNVKLQEETNKKLSEIGEVIFILKCNYKDGSWFGFGKKTTTIGMFLKGLDLSYLSTARRKELQKLFE